MQGGVRTQLAEQRHLIASPKKAYLRRPNRVKTAHKRQRQAKAKVMLRRSIELSLQQLPESGPGGVSTNKDPGFKKCLRKILGVGECQLLGHGFQLMYQMNQHFHSRCQIQDAGDLALSLKGGAHALILFGTFERPLVRAPKAT